MKIKYLPQYDERDCGAACLAMIAQFYGYETSVAKIRDLCKTSLDGTTALGIAKGAEKLGLECRTIKADDKLFNKRKQLHYPFIVHIEKEDQGISYEHYYVVYKITKKFIYIADPNPDIKKTKLSYSQFLKQWTGIALFFAPSPSFHKHNKQNKNDGFKSFFPIIFKQKGLVSNIVVASFLVTLISIVTSYFLQLLIDDYIPNGLSNTLSIMCIGLITAYVFQEFIGYIQQYFLIVLGQRLSIDIVLSYIKHLFKLPMDFFYTRKVGEITSRFNDANSIIDAVASSVLTILLDAGIAILMAMVLLMYNANMFLISVIAIPFYILIVVLFVKPFNTLNTEEMKAGASLESSVIESLNGMETIKALGAEQKRYKLVDEDYVNVLRRSFKTSRLTAIQESLKSTLKLVLDVFLLWYGSNLVIQNKLSLGQLMAFNALLGYFTEPIESIINLQSKVQTAVVSAKRLNEVFDVRSEFSNNRYTSISNNITNPDIHFKDVSFGYLYGTSVLNNISFKIDHNEKLALVGTSGSGKSTLVKLLIRFFDLTRDSGSILLNEVDIKTIERNTLRSLITYVPQDPHIFTGSILDNLLLGADDDVTFEEVLQATNLACIREDIESLPKGFDTEISESGTLSGGQRQRISLARALLTKSKILILDESTSNLDILTEKSVIDNLMTLQNKTIIFIAHRLTIAERVPRILMVQRGKIVGDGDHASLLQSNAFYQNLVNK